MINDFAMKTDQACYDLLFVTCMTWKKFSARGLKKFKCELF